MQFLQTAHMCGGDVRQLRAGDMRRSVLQRQLRRLLLLGLGVEHGPVHGRVPPLLPELLDGEPILRVPAGTNHLHGPGKP